MTESEYEVFMGQDEAGNEGMGAVAFKNLPRGRRKGDSNATAEVAAEPAKGSVKRGPKPKSTHVPKRSSDFVPDRWMPSGLNYAWLMVSRIVVQSEVGNLFRYTRGQRNGLVVWQEEVLLHRTAKNVWEPTGILGSVEIIAALRAAMEVSITQVEEV